MEFIFSNIIGGIIGIITNLIASKFFLKQNNTINRPILEMPNKLIETNEKMGQRV